jgi:NADH-quinone oxidoreductase subunit L
MVLLDVLNGAGYNATVYEWMTIGSLKMEVGFLIDSLTAMMMVVTFVSLMVHIYTIGYMEETPATTASSPTSRCSPSRC